METDHRDSTIQCFANNILRLGNECRALADENTRLKAEVERLKQDLVAVKYYGELLEFLKANAAKDGKPSV